MGKVLIEKYRGFDIEFDTNYERFQCIATDESVKESTSFTAVKKFIDDYKKANQEFKPFFVDENPESRFGNGKNIKIIGVRKDGRFISQDTDGKKGQVSDYNENDYMLYDPSNEQGMAELKRLKEKEDTQRIENNEMRKQIISSLKIVTLKDYKKTLEG